METDSPKDAKSNKLKLDPKRAIPKAVKALPARAKALIDIELPKVKRSKTEIDEPNRANPKVEKPLPIRAKERHERVEPRLM